MVLPGLIVKKVGMTRVIDDNGRYIPVTLVEVDNQKVTKILTPERDGYHGIQVGYYAKKEKQLTKPDFIRLQKAGISDCYSRFTEFRLDSAVEGLELGTELTSAGLEGVTSIDVVGITKGRGFQGVIKRWGFSTGSRTHGSMYHRRTGSLGSNTTPGRVYKNKKMPGCMGAERITIKNLKIVSIEGNVIAVKGSVPGPKTGFVVVKSAVKTDEKNDAFDLISYEEEVAEETVVETETKEEATNEEA